MGSLTLKMPEKYTGHYKAYLLTKEGEEHIPVNLKNDRFIFSEAVNLKRDEELNLIKFSF